MNSVKVAYESQKVVKWEKLVLLVKSTYSVHYWSLASFHLNYTQLISELVTSSLHQITKITNILCSIASNDKHFDKGEMDICRLEAVVCRTREHINQDWESN